MDLTLVTEEAQAEGASVSVAVISEDLTSVDSISVVGPAEALAEERTGEKKVEDLMVASEEGSTSEVVRRQ